MTIRILRQWEAPPGAVEAANADLATFSPPSDLLPYFRCYWEPGDWWFPVERLVIAEMLPRQVLYQEHQFNLGFGCESNSTLFAELEGPSPREGGHYDVAQGRYVHRQDTDGNELVPNITQRQWLLWRTEHAYAMPRWILQGANGGHKVSFNRFDEQLLRFRKLPSRPPWPGHPDHPYIPYSNRVREALLEASALAKLAVGFDLVRVLRAESEEERDRLTTAERQFLKLYDSWLDDQIDNVRVRGEPRVAA